MASSITVGGMLAGIVQFIVILTILSPIIQYSTPVAFQSNFTATYYPNGTINASGLLYKINTSLQQNLTLPFMHTVNNSTAVYQSAGYLQQFGGLAFIPLGLGSMYKSLIQAPKMIILIFGGLLSNPVLAGLGILVLLSTVIFGYMTALLALKVMGWILKNNIEEL